MCIYQHNIWIIEFWGIHEYKWRKHAFALSDKYDHVLEQKYLCPAVCKSNYYKLLNGSFDEIITYKGHVICILTFTWLCLLN